MIQGQGTIEMASSRFQMWQATHMAIADRALGGNSRVVPRSVAHRRPPPLVIHGGASRDNGLKFGAILVSVSSILAYFKYQTPVLPVVESEKDLASHLTL